MLLGDEKLWTVSVSGRGYTMLRPNDLSNLCAVPCGRPMGPSPSEAFRAEYPWFALRVKSNFERVAASHLGQRGYHEYLPAYQTRSQWSDRVKVVERPLFPGYVFCSFDPSSRLPVLATPGVLHIVGIGKKPAPVDESELEAVRATLQSGLSVGPWPFLQVGERVVVDRGPLRGLEGLVTHLKGAYRLVISITLLQRSIAAEIDREWIRPVRRACS